jgi:predicted RNA polymerase sigma factor
LLRRSGAATAALAAFDTAIRLAPNSADADFLIKRRSLVT